MKTINIDQIVELKCYNFYKVIRFQYTALNKQWFRNLFRKNKIFESGFQDIYDCRFGDILYNEEFLNKEYNYVVINNEVFEKPSVYMSLSNDEEKKFSFDSYKLAKKFYDSVKNKMKNRLDQ